MATSHSSSPPPPVGGREAQLYLDLLKRCLTNMVYGEQETQPVPAGRTKVGRWLARRWLARRSCRRGTQQVRPKPYDPEIRATGRDWSPIAHSMIGLRRLDNIQTCAEAVLADGVPGDFIETGVWRGGATIFMRALLHAYGVTDRKVWVVDSFEGLPPPDSERYPHDGDSRLHEYAALAVSLEQVRHNFDLYGLLDEQVVFLKGWFRDVLPTAPIEGLALLRLDGDMYESTMDSLRHLYPKLALGGFVIVDDYNAVAACKQAVHDYREAEGIREEIRITADGIGAYWRRTR